MLIKQGLQLIASGAVAQANMKLASVDAGAMIDTGVDWSAYAGDDAGNTPHMLVLYDSGGKRMQAFIGASGGGEALGGEIIAASDDRDFTVWGNVNWEAAYGGVPADGTGKMQVTQDAGTSGVILFLDTYGAGIVSGSLYKMALDVWRGTGTGLRLNVNLGIYTGYSIVYYGAGQTTYTKYIATKAGNQKFYVIGNDFDQEGKTFFIDNVTLKQVTDISTNGVHLHSTRGETNRNVASIDANFDLNDDLGYTFKLYKCP